MQKQKSILIIEDDADIMEVMRITLETKNYQILSTFNPKKGFKIAKDDKPDLIILDVMFGSRKKPLGLKYLVKMKQDKELASIPVLMTTPVNESYHDFDFSPNTDSDFLPADDFINKPAQPDDLLNKIDRLIKQKISKWDKYPKKNNT